MRVFLILFLLVNTLVQAKSQGLNFEMALNESYTQEVQAIASDEDYSIVAQAFVSGPFRSGGYILKVDTTGHILWKRILSTYIGQVEVVFVNKIFLDDEGGAYITGYALGQCDVGEFTHFVLKIDKDGSLVWIRKWQNLTDCMPDCISGHSKIKNVLALNVNQNPGYRIFVINSQGVILDSIPVNQGNVNGYAYNSTFPYIAYFQNALEAYNADGQIAKHVTFATTVINVHSASDTLYVQTKDSLVALNNQLERVYGIPFSSLENESGFKFFNDHFWVVSDSLSTQCNISIFNKKFEETGRIELPDVLSAPIKFDFKKTHITIGIDYKLAMYQSIRLLDFSLQSGNSLMVNRTDVGVVNIDPYNVQITPRQGPSLYDISISVKALVKNYGNNLMESVYLNHYIHYGVACNDMFYHESFEGLDLPPGDSVWIDCGSVHQITKPLRGDSLNLNFCMYTSSPNEITDLEVSNDDYCKLIRVNFAGIESLKAREPKLLKVIDLLGRATNPKPNEPQIYLYDNGSAKKVIQLE